MGNKLVNTTSVKLGIYEESTDPQLEGMLGDKKEWEDGRVFRLCSNGGTELTAGLRLQSVAVDSLDDKLLVYSTAAAGQKDIIVTVTSSHNGHAANLLKDAYLVVNQCAADGIGTFYKIKNHTIMTADSTATFTLYDKLTEALAASDEVTVCLNPFKAVILDVITAPVVGVPLINVTASDSDTTYYFWALVKGVGPATATGTMTVGDEVERENNGLVKTGTTTTESYLGIAYSAAETGDALIVKYF